MMMVAFSSVVVLVVVVLGFDSVTGIRSKLYIKDKSLWNSGAKRKMYVGI